MRLWQIILLLLGVPISAASAQPLDTLIGPYHTIQEIYPLQDSTFILIGTGKNILVEKRDFKAKKIWSVPLVSFDRDYLTDFRFDINSNDSVVQIATADKSCDAYGRTLYKIFTVHLSGHIQDSQKVSFGSESGLIHLLSGVEGQPRLAYFENKEIVLMYANKDTIHLPLTWPNGDTTNSDFIGSPKDIAMCPNGDILVGTNSQFVFYFRIIDGLYKVDEVSFGGGFQTLLCTEDQFFISINNHYLELWGNNIPGAYFNLPDHWIYKLTWRNPILAIRTFSFESPDTMFFLDSHLNLVYKEEVESGHISTMAVDQGTTYSVGTGNVYTDFGFLETERQDNHEGPKNYDIELVDFVVNPYTSAQWYNWGGGYYLEIPSVHVTIRNNGEFPVERIEVYYYGPYSICSDTTWQREIQNMHLMPGETNTYSLQDVFFIRDYPEPDWSKTCLYIQAPDQHFDDYFDDNDLCKKVAFNPLYQEPDKLPIHHTPSIVSDYVQFVSPENILFDLTIYDLNSRVVFQEMANTSNRYSVNLQFMPPGLYVFQYKLDDGRTFLEKIVKY